MTTGATSPTRLGDTIEIDERTVLVLDQELDVAALGTEGTALVRPGGHPGPVADPDVLRGGRHRRVRPGAARRPRRRGPG